MDAPSNEPPKTKRPFVGRLELSIALILCAGMWFLHIAWRNKTGPFERNAIADVSWVAVGPPFMIRCLVLARDGTPCSGREVCVTNGSGGAYATTGSDGWAVLDMGEPEVNAITVNDVEVMSRPTFLADLKPTCANGLVVTIVIKDPKLIVAPAR